MIFKKQDVLMNENYQKDEITVHVDFQIGLIKIDDEKYYFDELDIEHLYDDHSDYEDIISKKLDLDNNYIFMEV